jgi:hypothetical protein
MRRSLKIAIAVLYAALLAIAPMVYHWRPLVPSSAMHATYEQGQSCRRHARVYRMLFRDVVFVELLDCPPEADRWFAVDLSRRVVCRPNWPERSPYLHHNHDMSLGCAVDDTMKHDDLWQVTWSAGEVAWSYGDVTVRVQGT